MIPLALMLGPSPAEIPPRRVLLVPCGPVPPGVLTSLDAGLGKILAAEVVRGEEVPVPEEAYSPRRRQYLAESFLNSVKSRHPSRQELILGVTVVDLYVPALNFVFGLADSRQKTGVISLARLDPKFYGRPGDPGLLQERVLKEAVHELGHLLSLGHCRNPACIMFFSNTLADTDRKGPDFCPACRQRLRWSDVWGGPGM
jgi:archaemetzincin